MDDGPGTVKSKEGRVCIYSFRVGDGIVGGLRGLQLFVLKRTGIFSAGLNAVPRATCLATSFPF